MKVLKFGEEHEPIGIYDATDIRVTVTFDEEDKRSGPVVEIWDGTDARGGTRWTVPQSKSDLAYAVSRLAQALTRQQITWRGDVSDEVGGSIPL